MFNNIKSLLLKETIIVNLLRSFFAGVVWLVVAVAGGQANDSAVFLFPVVAPILLLVFYLLSQILRIIKLGGVGSLMCMLVAVPGDPLVFMLKQISPGLVPVQKFGFINFAPMIYVYQDTAFVDKSKKASSEACPYNGRVIATKDGEVLGFSWPHKATIFTIDEDWIVKKEGSEFGWIDRDGQIREGLKGEIDATLSPGKVIGRISNNKLVINNDTFGELHKY